MKPIHSKLIAVACVLAMVVALPSCSCSDGNRRALSATSGKVGEVVVVCKKSLWNGEVGEVVRESLAVDYPFLPQSEPSFDLINISADMFSTSFRIHRNLMIIEVGEEHKEAKFIPQNDIWASPQLVVKVMGPDEASVAELLKERKSDYLWAILEQAEVDRQSKNAVKYQSSEIRKQLTDKFGIVLSIPESYRKNPTEGGDEADFYWYGYDTNFATLGIFVYSYPYTDTAQFSAKELNAKREDFLKRFVPSSREGSYMVTSPYVEPEYTSLTYKGTFMGRLRGLWEVHNGYMGGPFVSYSIIVNGKIVTVEGFTYAPRTEKRDYVRQLLGILLTVGKAPVENATDVAES